MIAFVRGTVALKELDGAVVDVGGVGYYVAMSLNALTELPQVGAEVTVLTYTHVREDTLQLFGFVATLERDLFRLLISVNGVGPKLAMQILSGVSAQSLVDAISLGDLGRLQSAPGVGKKTAQRLVLDLKDKVASLTLVHAGTGAKPGVTAARSSLRADLHSALVNLGYKSSRVDKAIDQLEAEELGDDFETALKAALKLVT